MKSSIKQRLIHEEKETEDVDDNDEDHLVIQQISTSDKENSLPCHLRHNTNLPGFKQQQQQSSRIPVPTQHQPPQPSTCLLYTSPSPRDQRGSRMPSSA